MDLEARLENIRSRQDLVEFIGSLRKDLDSNPNEWENPSLSLFLEAMAAWIDSMDGYYENQGLPFSEDQPWQTFATMLMAARVYE